MIYVKKLATMRLVKYMGLGVALVLFAACSGTNTKKTVDVPKPTLMTTDAMLPVQEFDKKTTYPVPYEAEENPYIAQKGRIKKESVAAFIEAKRALKAKQWDKAKAVLTQLSEADDSLSGPQMLLGDIALEQKDEKLAEEHFLKALAINKKNINVYIKLALLQREQGRFIEAQNTLAQALTVWPDFPEAHLNIGVLYDIYLNHPIRAQQHMEAYLYLTGWENEKVETWLGEIQSRTGIPTKYQPLVELPELPQS